MALPMQTAPNYTVRLPSNNEEVTFRPFLVKEQKYLLLMKEGENSKDTFSAIKQLIKSVTSESVDVEKLPMYDIEYLFLQIRAKSVRYVMSIAFTEIVMMTQEGYTSGGNSEVVVDYTEGNKDNKRLEQGDLKKIGKDSTGVDFRI